MRLIAIPTARLTSLRRASERTFSARTASLDLGFVAHWVFNGICGIGAALAVLTAIILIRGNSGGAGYDTAAYWLAARHIVSGEPLYAVSSISEFAAYKYPPIYAQMFVPAGWFDVVLVSWVWRLSGLLCLRYLAGSWKLTLFACAFAIPVLRELALGNVTLQIGAILLYALRHPRAAALIPWVAAIKFGPGLLIPYLWLAEPRTRWPLLAGFATLAAASLASYAVAPGLWADWLGTFGWETSNQVAVPDPAVVALIPWSTGLDFAVRFSIGAAVALYAAATHRRALAFVAAVATNPIMDLGRLAPLVALWQLRTKATETSPGSEPDVSAGSPMRSVPATP